jgi:hypothetical protein
MKKIFITLFIVFSLISVSKAQDYNTGIGLRAGYYNGLTIKHFIRTNTALEGIFTSRWRGLRVTGLYEKEYSIANADGLNWYFGGGAHIGFWNGDYVNWGETGSQYTVVGLDAILGLEYNFREVPLNLSLDWKPAFNFVGYSGAWADGGALSIRYIF